MTDATLVPVETGARLDALAARYARADGPALRLLNLLGAQAENLLERLPDRVKEELEVATVHALAAALEAAQRSRRTMPDQSPWVNTSITTAMGAAGGFGGLPTALAELPFTTTVLFRAILAEAHRQGFDPAAETVRREALEVFSAAGPLSHDDGSETGFLAARVTLTGATVRGIIARIAPRLSAVLGQKLAAQTVPVLGAAAGAATNYAYTRYYQEIAGVRFGLMRLSEETGADPALLTEEIRARMPRR